MRATDFINIYCEHEVPVDEGVNDPYIFKAVFLAGGPGSGKSFINIFVEAECIFFRCARGRS